MGRHFCCGVQERDWGLAALLNLSHFLPKLRIEPATFGFDSALQKTVCMCSRGAYGVRGELWRVVVDVCDGDNSCACIRKTVHGISFHVSGLNNQCVLRHFLQGETTQ